MPTQGFELDPNKIRDIAPEALDERGRLRVLPAAFWAGTTVEERALFGHLHGLYSYPTVELVERLREIIGGRKAVEIGAGHGVLAEALGILATDNRMQEKTQIKAFYEAAKQPVVPYGSNVIESDAHRAIYVYRPQVVIACWVTHRYDYERPEAGGNAWGVNEEAVLDNCEEYVFVGNQRVHRDKAIWSLPHTIEYPSYVYSRSQNGTPDFLARWPGSNQR